MTPHVSRVRVIRTRCLGLVAALICVACAWQDADAQPPRPGGGVASAGGESSWAVDPASSRIYVFVDKGSLIGHTHAIEGRLAGGDVVLGRRQQAGRLVLIGIWTRYIAVGSVLKDRRLLHFIGDPYRCYQAGVPGYPGMPLGPLARIPLPADSP